jgi:hypothetical protein
MSLQQNETAIGGKTMGWEEYVPAEQRIALLRKHFWDKVPVADICDEYGIDPAVFARWTKEIYEDGVWPRDGWDDLLEKIVKSEGAPEGNG